MSFSTSDSVQTALLAVPWVPIAVTALVLATTWIYRTLVGGTQRQLSKIPVVGAEAGDAAQQRMAFMVNAKKVVDEGYKKFRNSCFRVYTTSKSSTKHTKSRRLYPDIFSARFRCGHS